MGVEAWLSEPPTSFQCSAPLLLVRHDVDQCPQSALTMATTEAEFGVHSSWYFRWRTAHPRVVAEIREAGHTIGLHYETLTRLTLERRLAAGDPSGLIDEARELLMQELAAFRDRFGAIRSACPHGDTRVRGVHNGALLRGQDLERYGLQWDVNDAVGERGIDVWLTDRSRAEGSWSSSLDPIDLIVDRRSPLLLVVHPNNWISGPALWWDRLVPGGVRTGSDNPPERRFEAGAATGERIGPGA
jgi:hypothetical protein